MRSRQPGMSPEKMAIAIAAIAGIGAMKKVTGTSSAVAIVAVSPGTAPTNRPNSDASSITTMLYGSNTIVNACAQAPLMMIGPSPRDALQEAPGQRHPQQLVERDVDDEREHERERHDGSRAHAEDREERREVERAGD